MRFTILRDALRDAATHAAGSVLGKSTIPVLQSVLIEADAETVRFTATNLDSTLRLIVKADVGAAGSTTVPAKLLNDIAGRLPVGPVSIEATSGGVVVKSGRAKMTLPTMDVSEFPIAIFPEKSGQGWRLDGEALRALAAIGFAASEEETRPIMRGVHVYKWEGEVRAIATNGHRMVRVTLPVEGAPDLPYQDGLIVHPSSLSRAARLFSDGCEVHRTERDIIFSDARAELSARVIEGPYPDGERLFPTEHTASVSGDRKALIETLKRVVLAATDNTHRMRMSVNGALRITASHDGASADEEADLKTSGNMEIGFNAVYAIELLSYLESEEVEWRFFGPLRAALLKPVGADSPTILFMPIRLDV